MRNITKAELDAFVALGANATLAGFEELYAEAPVIPTNTDSTDVNTCVNCKKSGNSRYCYDCYSVRQSSHCRRSSYLSACHHCEDCHGVPETPTVAAVAAKRLYHCENLHPEEGVAPTRCIRVKNRAGCDLMIGKLKVSAATFNFIEALYLAEIAAEQAREDGTAVVT